MAGAYASFLTDVGIDDETAGQGSVDFKVIGDGVTLYDSGNVTGSAAVGHVNVPVIGVRTLRLVATNGVAGSIDYDHADWAGARMVAAAVVAVAPMTRTLAMDHPAAAIVTAADVTTSTAAATVSVPAVGAAAPVLAVATRYPTRLCPPMRPPNRWCGAWRRRWQRPRSSSA